MLTHPETARLRAAIESLLPHAAAWSGTMYRFTTVRNAARPRFLTGRGSRRYGGRWNARGLFNCVYGSLDPHVAMDESRAAFLASGIPPEQIPPQVLVAVRLRLRSILDLTNRANLAKLRLSPGKLAAVDWEAQQNAGREAITQAIGRLAWETRLEGILVHSARIRGAANLAVFPGRRLPGSSWRIVGARQLPKF
jgi:RES domain-containing protein